MAPELSPPRCLLVDTGWFIESAMDYAMDCASYKTRLQIPLSQVYSMINYIHTLHKQSVLSDFKC